MLTRIEWMKMRGAELDDYRCRVYYTRTKQSLLDGTAAWSPSLEEDYMNYCDDIAEELGGDDYSHRDTEATCVKVREWYCNGRKCPHFKLCARYAYEDGEA